MNRRTGKGIEMSPWEAIGFLDGLKMFTYNAAYLASEEHNKGSIEKGKFADLVVLNKNPLKDGVEDMLVDYTILDGEIVFKRE
jgi:predicted amidohydrolase YtcJ